LSNLKLLRRITRTENILHRNFTRRQVAIQNRVASNIGISQSTFSVKVLNLFSRSRRKTNRSEERFSRNAETDLVCRLLLEKKKKTHKREKNREWARPVQTVERLTARSYRRN